MNDPFIKCGTLPPETASAIEALDTDGFDFFTVDNGHTELMIDERFVTTGENFDPVYAWAFDHFADAFTKETQPLLDNQSGVTNDMLSSCAARVNRIRANIPSRALPVLEMQVALGHKRIEAIAALQKAGSPIFFERTGATQKIGEKEYPLARVRLDLEHYFTDARYKEAFDTFRDQLGKQSGDLLKQPEKMAPDIRSFYNLTRFPKIVFDIPLGQKRFDKLKGFDEIGLVSGRDELFEGYPVARFEFEIAALDESSSYQKIIVKYAKKVVASYDDDMRDKKYSPKKMAPDIRNLYSLHTTLLAFVTIVQKRYEEKTAPPAGKENPPGVPGKPEPKIVTGPESKEGFEQELERIRNDYRGWEIAVQNALRESAHPLWFGRLTPGEARLKDEQAEIWKNHIEKIKTLTDTLIKQAVDSVHAFNTILWPFTHWVDNHVKNRDKFASTAKRFNEGVSALLSDLSKYRAQLQDRISEAQLPQ